MRRIDLDDYTDAGYEAYRARVIRDIAEAKARGWTQVTVAMIAEPPVPMGLPPADDPRHDAARAIRLPDYGDGEDGGYRHIKAPLIFGTPTA